MGLTFSLLFIIFIHESINLFFLSKLVDLKLEISVKYKSLFQANSNIDKSLCSNAPKLASVKKASVNPISRKAVISFLTISIGFLIILVLIPPPHSQKTHLKGQPLVVSKTVKGSNL